MMSQEAMIKLNTGEECAARVNSTTLCANRTRSQQANSMKLATSSAAGSTRLTQFEEFA